MNRMKFYMAGLFALSLCGAVASASTDGVLIVGTHSEVAKILQGTDVHPVYSQSNESDLVGVRITRSQVSIYEGDCVGDILNFIGGVVEGGVVVTLEAGCDLWNLLEGTAHVTLEVGITAVRASVWILRHAECVVLDGISLVVKSGQEILAAIFNLLHPLTH